MNIFHHTQPSFNLDEYIHQNTQPPFNLDESIYRMSEEECARLREGVPYGKVY
jgi:hypothetical protein